MSSRHKQESLTPWVLHHPKSAIFNTSSCVIKRFCDRSFFLLNRFPHGDLMDPLVRLTSQYGNFTVETVKGGWGILWEEKQKVRNLLAHLVHLAHHVWVHSARSHNFSLVYKCSHCFVLATTSLTASLYHRATSNAQSFFRTPSLGKICQKSFSVSIIKTT